MSWLSLPICLGGWWLTSLASSRRVGTLLCYGSNVNLDSRARDRNRQNVRTAFRAAGLNEFDRLLGGSSVTVPSDDPNDTMIGLLQTLEMFGKDRESETSGERETYIRKNVIRER